jgi:hypothetical protein
MKHEFLKHWRVVRYYIKQKHGLSHADLDMLLFLHAHGRFTKQCFMEYGEILSWDPQRFHRLQKEGWIVIWRKQHGRVFSIYDLSHRAKSEVGHIYRMLLGESPIPTSERRNPLFKKKISYNDKVYRNVIKEIKKGKW